MEDGLAVDLPRSCFPPRGASLSSCLPQGHLVQAMRVKFVLTPRPISLRRERESELELYSSPGSGDESHSWGNTVQKRNRPSSSVTSPFDRCHLAQVRWLCPSSWTDNKTISRTKKNPGSFPSHLWGDNREHFCFGGHKSAKLRTLEVFV